MAQNLGTLVVIGWRPEKPSKVLGDGGPLDECENALWPREELSGFTFERMFLIGEFLAYLDTTNLPENVIPIPDEATRVFHHNRKYDSYPGTTQVLPESAYSRLMLFSKRTDALVSFCCFDPQLAESAFELAALVKTETLQNRLWLCRSLVTGSRERKLFYPIPDIITGPENVVEVKNALPDHEKPHFKRWVELGINHLRMFLTAKYHLRENAVPVDGWALQIGSVWLSLILSLNKIVPGYVDTDSSRELFESSAMRKLVTDKTLCALSNYFTFAYGGEKVTASKLSAALEAFRRENGEEAERILSHPLMSQCGEDLKTNMAAWSTPNLWRDIFRQYASQPYL